ncbi:MAG: glycoside hydrolase family 16 protein [Segetibacter sp.]|nr:glycoside hydrolase family 16 protein [Segetibacter sp.]
MKTRLFAAVSLFMLLNSCDKGDSTGAPTPRVSVSDLTLPEGNGGTTNFEFTVKLANATPNVVTLNYSVVEGTAKAGEDFVVANNLTFTFQPNEVEKKLVVNVVADDLREGDESFTLLINSATNANVPALPATGTIINDDTKVPFTNGGYDAPTTYPGYALAWSDEFNGTALNSAIWSFQNGDGCPNICGWGNNELEYYRPENLSFQDGKMIIEARKENFSGRSYTSSKILTEGKKTIKFGRIDIRAKMPKGKGIWPALWLLPQSSMFGGWPRSGEIDLMEYLGHETNKVYGTLHFGPGPGSVQVNKNYTLPTGTFADEFHVFSIEWKQDQIKWLVDGNVYGTANKSDFGTNNYPFNEQFYLIFNMAIGGNWPGSPDTSTYFPQWFIIDYVRVYQ